jgi:hypothetical protein
VALAHVGLAYLFTMVVVTYQVASHYGLIAGDVALWVIAGSANLWVVNKPADERFRDFLGASAVCGVFLAALLVVQSVPRP